MSGRLLSRASGRERWLRAYEGCGYEPFAHPDYSSVMSRIGETPGCFLYESPDCEAILPLTLRPLPASLGDGIDAVSPYGYGGPFVVRGKISGDFFSELVKCLRDAGIISFFGRLSLDFPSSVSLPPDARIVALSENVVVDLTRTYDQQWSNYAHKVRKNVKKARRAGLKVSIADEFTSLSEFTELYSRTMVRRSASTWYRFDAQAFQEMLEGVPNCLVAEVRTENDELASAELLLRSDRFLYSFLGGTDAQFFPIAPNDLLKDAVIQYGGSLGLEGYVLGGGFAANDGIVRYKKSFDHLGGRWFKGLQVVADQVRYDALCALVADGTSPEDAATDFFPLYRAPMVGE